MRLLGAGVGVGSVSESGRVRNAISRGLINRFEELHMSAHLCFCNLLLHTSTEQG